MIGAFYGLAWWLRGDVFTFPRRDDGVELAVPYLLTVTALTAVGLGLERSGFGLTVAWATFGAALFGSGLRTEKRMFRLQGVAVFGVTTAKVFLFDTLGVDTVARTISFLGASFWWRHTRTPAGRATARSTASLMSKRARQQR